MTTPSHKADWLAWMLHLVYGLLFGVIAGVLILSFICGFLLPATSDPAYYRIVGSNNELLRAEFLFSRFPISFVLFSGSVVLFAGLQSMLGERCLMPWRRYTLLQPRNFKHSRKSKIASSILICIGVISVGVSLTSLIVDILQKNG